MAGRLMTTRRDAVAAAVGLATFAAAGPGAAIPPPEPVNFVLVHGAWHGGWCWREVAGQLRERGFEVFAPTLTGLGDRLHLARADTGIDVHATDIAALIEAEELMNVVLVLHSYAGIPGSYAATRVAERIRRVVYLDALLPTPGKAFFDTAPPAQRAATMQALVDGFRLPPFPAEMFDIPKDSFQHRWVSRRLTTMPIAPFTDMQPPLPAAYAQLAKTYVECTGNSLDGPKAGTAAARAAGWPVVRLDAGHDAMVTAPTETADLLASLAGA
jgi:pimeloyl-ACP methyl ester carboxylesterase